MFIPHHSKKFLDCLKAEQDLTDVKLTKRLCRERPEPITAKWIKYDQGLQAIADVYDEYDVLDCLKVIGSMI